MKKSILSFVTIALTLSAAPARADIQSVLQRLESAEQQIGSAQQQIGWAKQELIQMLQTREPGFICVLNFNAFENGNRSYSARGATEEEARANLLFQCSSDSSHHYGSLCKDFVKISGTCRTTR